MVLGMGPMELGIILLVVLVIFGPKNLPKLGSAIGKTVKNVREGMEEGDSEVAPAEPQVSQSAVEKNEGVE
ncbi:twin-arginine translocase TatA/TatE family subunit [Olsenella sp. An285]|uniref:Sec-independent protein translocase subunit TatA/TatB n=1 Tax=Olsenella sp. An285 TaxID=1965621 RepID=UPI000B378124|nr:twin-arginine translocase TatA/TatE family subunit [Olsenella sp. An285]OUO47576.1 twin-arginine translocase TatA/TatE family subunit [Olsenella sp. An285]